MHKYSRLLFSALTILLLCQVSSFAAKPVADPDAPAEASAKKWLALVDAGNYDQGWQQGSTLLRNAVPKAQFETQLKAVRTPIGKVISRTLMTKEATTSVPGGPDGEYVVIRYQTKFQKKANAIETITPMKEGSNWRVSGYYIN